MVVVPSIPSVWSRHLACPLEGFFRTLKNGKNLSIALEMNLFKAATFPIKLYTSFIVLGDFISIIAFTLSEFASMPH